MLVDLGSSNGTTLTRDGKAIKLEPFKPVLVSKDDVIIFGLSSRKYKVEPSKAPRKEESKESRDRSRSGR